MDRTGSGLSGRFVRKPLRADPSQGWDECEIGGTWAASPVRRWRRFFYETSPVPSRISREGRSWEKDDRSVIILARPLGVDERDLRIHCFLPTATTSQLRWVVQGDFEPSANREQLRQTDWNAWLMKKAGAALARAVVTSARQLGQQPWDLIPLDEEVEDSQQRIAYAAAANALRSSSFLQTHKGWRRPTGSTWGYWPGTTEAILEADLPVVSGRSVSYIEDEVLGPITGTTRSRAEDVLVDLGSEPVDCVHLARLFAADDAAFNRVRRDARWWLAALGLIATRGTSDDRSAVASTRCLPVRGGGRVRPSPSVDLDGYVVAFSRSDLTADLSAYLKPSDSTAATSTATDADVGDPRVEVRQVRMVPLQPSALAALQRYA